MSRRSSSVETVLVGSSGGTWGSGVIVDWRHGLVVTCGHVVRTDRQG